MAWDCLCVGLLVADYHCAPIAQLPRAGQLVLTEGLELSIGGCAANASVDLARLGVQVGVVGCVGADSFGDFVLSTLRGAGVGTARVRRGDRGTSGTMIVNVAGEDRRFIHAIGANGCLTIDDMPWDLVRQAQVLYVGGYLALPALDADALGRLFGRAREAGIRTVLDVVLPGPGDYAAQLRPVLPHTDVFLPNGDEAERLTGHADPREQIAAFRAWGAGTVVITRGGEGTWLASDRVRLRAGVYPVEFVGGTGAGDAFDAGYILALLSGRDEADALRWASAVGASCVRSPSATASVFTRPELDTYLARHALAVEAW